MRLRLPSVLAVALLPLLVACGPSPGAEANDRGKKCLADKDFACARAAFTEAVQQKPDDAAYHYNLGLALGHLEQHDAAAASLREALRLRPDFGAAKDALDIVNAKKAPKAQGGA